MANCKEPYEQIKEDLPPPCLTSLQRYLQEELFFHTWLQNYCYCVSIPRCRTPSHRPCPKRPVFVTSLYLLLIDRLSTHSDLQISAQHPHLKVVSKAFNKSLSRIKGESIQYYRERNGRHYHRRQQESYDRSQSSASRSTLQGQSAMELLLRKLLTPNISTRRHDFRLLLLHFLT